jgi:Tetratricopeptide repeat
MPTFVLPAIAMALLAPIAAAQKPAPPPPNPPVTSPNRPVNSSSPGWEPTQPREELVMFLRGRVATHDGTAVPHDALVERICNNKVRQEVYVSPRGEFSMQLGSRANSFPDASAEPISSNSSANKDQSMGIPRRELMNCELRASVRGFHPGLITLLNPDVIGGSIDAGVIVVHRATKVEGTTVSAIEEKAPKNATKAYEKGVQAEKKGKLADAQKQLETAVEIYPSSAKAWFQLGRVLQKQDDKEAARKAYTQASIVDNKYLPPYLSLASMAFERGEWNDVLNLTDHILDLDPLSHAADTTYILDLDPLNYSAAYFYNAMANYKLNKMEEAEKSGLKAEHVDLRRNFPQLHLLMAELFARKSHYAMAIAELETYLELVPNAKDADQVREHLAKLEKMKDSVN